MENKKVREQDYVDHIQNISYNPFFSSKLLHSFCKGYSYADVSNSHNQEVPISLLQLVLPFIYYGESKDPLLKINAKSSLRSTFINDLDRSMALVGLQERILFFKKLTNLSIIVAVNENRIYIDRNKVIATTFKIDYREVQNKHIKDNLRAAYYLGRMCGKMSEVDIFRLLGVVFA